MCMPLDLGDTHDWLGNVYACYFQSVTKEKKIAVLF